MHASKILLVHTRDTQTRVFQHEALLKTAPVYAYALAKFARMSDNVSVVHTRSRAKRLSPRPHRANVASSFIPARHH